MAAGTDSRPLDRADDGQNLMTSTDTDRVMNRWRSLPTAGLIALFVIAFVVGMLTGELTLSSCDDNGDPMIGGLRW